MTCCRYRVYEYDTQGNAHDTGKEFTTSLEESKAWQTQHGYGKSNYIDPQFLLLAFFSKMFAFTLSSGYTCTPEDANGEHIIGWRGNTWKLKLIKPLKSLP